jgi:hypothetical protein
MINAESLLLYEYVRISSVRVGRESAFAMRSPEPAVGGPSSMRAPEPDQRAESKRPDSPAQESAGQLEHGLVLRSPPSPYADRFREVMSTRQLVSAERHQARLRGAQVTSAAVATSTPPRRTQSSPQAEAGGQPERPRPTLSSPDAGLREIVDGVRMRLLSPQLEPDDAVVRLYANLPSPDCLHCGTLLAAVPAIRQLQRGVALCSSAGSARAPGTSRLCLRLHLAGADALSLDRLTVEPWLSPATPLALETIPVRLVAAVALGDASDELSLSQIPAPWRAGGSPLRAGEPPMLDGASGAQPPWLFARGAGAAPAPWRLASGAPGDRTRLLYPAAVSEPWRCLSVSLEGSADEGDWRDQRPRTRCFVLERASDARATANALLLLLGGVCGPRSNHRAARLHPL